MNQNYKTSKIPSQIIKFILKTTYTNFKLHQNLPIKFLCGRLNERERERERVSPHTTFIYIITIYNFACLQINAPQNLSHSFLHCNKEISYAA